MINSLRYNCRLHLLNQAFLDFLFNCFIKIAQREDVCASDKFCALAKDPAILD